MGNFLRPAALALGVMLCTGQAAYAADEFPARECARAYQYFNHFRIEAKKLNLLREPGSKVDFAQLGSWVENYEHMGPGAIDYSARATELEKKYPNQFEIMQNGTAFAFDSVDYVRNIIMEAPSASLNMLLAPNTVYQEQRPLFEKVHACDVMFHYSPALGTVPSLETILARLRARMDKESADKNKRLESLDTMACAVRMGLAVQLVPPGPAQQAMNQQFMSVINKVRAASPDLPPERIKTMLERGMQEQAELLKRKSDYKVNDLIDEVNACENKLGLPHSGLQKTGG